MGTPWDLGNPLGTPWELLGTLSAPWEPLGAHFALFCANPRRPWDALTGGPLSARLGGGGIHLICSSREWFGRYGCGVTHRGAKSVVVGRDRRCREAGRAVTHGRAGGQGNGGMGEWGNGGMGSPCSPMWPQCGTMGSPGGRWPKIRLMMFLKCV